MGKHSIWSFTDSAYARPSPAAVQSVCKHAPLRSIALVPALDAPARPGQQQQQPARAPYPMPDRQRLQQLEQQLQQMELLVQHNQQQQQTGRQVGLPGPSERQQLDSCNSWDGDSIQHPAMHDVQFGQCSSGKVGEQHLQQKQWQQQQWQAITCCATPAQQQLADELQEAALPLPSLQHQVVVVQPANNSTERTEHIQQRHLPPQQAAPTQTATATATRATGAPQPPPLFRLIDAAKRRTLAPTAEQIQWRLNQLQPLLPELSADHLAQAAWAAGQLAQRQAPTQHWLQLLLEAGSNHFAAGSMDETSTATLLQALVKLQQQPGETWCVAACASMAVEQWSSPRALSTVAACLPQLGHVPSSSWAGSFFAASAASLPAFPAISLARMLHGVLAWQLLQQLQQGQQQQQQQGLHQQELQQQGQPGSHMQQHQQLCIPEQWLLDVLHSLYTHSSQLKPPELAMVLQSLQRLQLQQQQLLLPPPGQQPSTPLQQAGQQLFHALLPAVLQQLKEFQPKDLTVMLAAVAALQHGRQQQQQHQEQVCLDSVGVSWSWLQRVLVAAEAHLSQLEPRGLATCLTAAAVLIKPHLQRQQQQQGTCVAAAQPGQPAAAQTSEQQQTRQPSQPVLVKPLQRWLQRQQEAAQPAPAAAADPVDPAAPAEPAAAHQQFLQQLTANGAAAPAGVASCWQRWLSSFYTFSSSQLLEFSSEDLTVTACSLASLQQVPPVTWYEAMLQAVQQQQPRMSGGQASGIAWALGRMALLPSQHNPGVSLVPSGSWMQRLYAAPAAAEKPAAAAAAAGEDSMAAAAAGSSREALVMGASEPAAAGCSYSISSCSAPELVRLMWAAGVCDYDPEDSWWAAAEQQLFALLSPPSSPTNARTSAPASSHASPKQQQQVQQAAVLPARLLGALLQAYAAAGRNAPAVLQQAILAPHVRQQLVSGHAVNTFRLLRGLRQSGCSVPQAWLQQLALDLQPRLGLLGPGELPLLLCRLAAAGLTASALEAQGFTAYASGSGAGSASSSSSGNDSGSDACSDSEVVHGYHSSSSRSWRNDCLAAAQQLLPQMSVRELSLLLWGVARLQLQPPPAWLEGVLLHLQAGFIDAEPAALALAVDALSRLGYMPSGDWMGGFMMAMHRRVAAMSHAMAAGASSSSSVSSVSSISSFVRVIIQTLWALAGLNASPNPKWMKLMLLALHQQLPLLQPRHVAVLLLVLARLRCRPSPVFLQSLLDRLGDCSSCSALDLVHLVYAAATLRWQPSRHWCQLYLAASAGKLRHMTPQGLALVQWGLAVIRVTPPESWRWAAVAAVCAQLEAFDARALGMVVWSWGRHMVHLTPKQDGKQQQRQQLAGVQQQQETQQQQEPVVQQQQGLQRAQYKPHVPRVALPKPCMHVMHPEQRQIVAERVLAAAWQLRGSYSAASLVHLLMGVAKMQLQPGQAWLHDMVLQGSCEKLSVLDGYELQQLVWALAMLGYRAQQGWLRSVALLLEVRPQRQDATRHSAEWALGKLQQLAVQDGDVEQQEQ